MSVLECRNLCKAYYRNAYVLYNLSFTLPKGRIVGLLGPNGCGKSTLMKIITGLLQPNGGEVLVDGKPIGEESKAVVSYLPERTYFNNWMRVSQLVEYFDEFYDDFDPDKAYRLLADLGISPESKLKSLSKGAKEKVQLILVMSRNAKLYLLDEPIAGVDPAARDYILRTIVTNYNPEATVVITTHLIADVEQVLDDYIFLTFGGRILQQGSVDEARMQHGCSLDELFREVFRCSQNF